MWPFTKRTERRESGYTDLLVGLAVARAGALRRRRQAQPGRCRPRLEWSRAPSLPLG